MQEGSRIHAAVQAEGLLADPEYRREVFLRAELEVDDFTVRLEGRADGLLRRADDVLIEEDQVGSHR